ncbi:hypothetical protein HGRIS_013529 [Hohenbuehelia grisea]|uniref:Alpha-ketoglutarate-dependent dioxygenase AlkB-like domain-containing protein n=1 Tax=Hohenbuehelia grisea TaxID=104357 RepID=A0ABR3IVY3_9AGAR
MSLLRILKRTYASYSRIAPDFNLIPDFLSPTEQRTLLSAALQKLDAQESIQFRRRRKALKLQQRKFEGSSDDTNCVQDMFYPDECYEFQEGHFDGVIANYRETHVTSWPDNIDTLPPILERLKTLYPSQDIQTHVLHLASSGVIHPHVDNLSASGSWILGVSLGSERILRLERQVHGCDQEVYDILLPSGSIYIQKSATLTTATFYD